MKSTLGLLLHRHLYRTTLETVSWTPCVIREAASSMLGVPQWRPPRFPPICSPRMTPSTSTERNPSPLSTRANMPFHVLLITSLLARLSLLKNTMYLIIGLYDPFLALRFCLSRLTFQFQVKFRAPSDLDELTLPVCLGFVMISHTIPYYGVGAALKKRPGNLYPQTSTLENSTLPTQSIGIRCLQSERSKASFCSHSLRPTRIWLPGYAIDPTSVFAPVQCLTNQSLKKLTALLHAIAMNDLGGKSNTGEGGEDASCSLVMPDGDTMRSAIKQVASGQFKVTSKYLANSDELFLNFNIVQIKMAQGAKLPGHKVTKSIAKTRHSTAGVGLISPPPHHNIYSIEDLKTVDLRLQVFQSKGAGLGESVGSRICQSPLRTRPGGGPSNIRTARDLAIAALLSAEKFGFATTPLIAIGCIMMRYFHQLVSPILFSSPQSLNHCFLPKHLPCRCCSPRPSLKSKFTGQPEHIIKFFYHVAEELRTHMAKMGFRTMNEMVGRTDLLKVDRTLRNPKTVNIDLSVVLKPAWKMRPVFATFKAKQQNHQMYARLDDKFIDEAEPAKGLPVRIEADGKNIELSVMDGHLSSLLRRMGKAGYLYLFSSSDCLLHLLTRSRYSLVVSNSLASDEKELEQDTIHVDMRGSAGQSLGALLASAITLELEGDANDHWPTGCLPAPILTLQGRIKRYYWHFATLGEAYLCGIAAERLAVRNLGLIAVVKGVGNHGCEYMTCRRAGRNFAARMSGGIAYVLDMTRDFKSKVNQEMVELVTFNDTHKIAGLRKLRVMPLDYKAVLEAGSKAAIPSDPHRHMPGFAIKGDTYYPVEDKAKTNVNNLLEVLTATLAPPEPPVVDLEDTMVDEASAKNIVERLDKTKGFMKYKWLNENY
ncbi:glutamate synthase [NADPH] [Puccinia sorghi]|uniref:Glutamate synthase [NADPH] n=1 Tax=Puccinia sorghi TaxID=27349 RepID=A0A0L6V3L0_9BASI|nr:glutamate synthase [NADPH] [Puccinia sorghi]